MLISIQKLLSTSNTRYQVERPPDIHPLPDDVSAYVRMPVNLHKQKAPSYAHLFPSLFTLSHWSLTSFASKSPADLRSPHTQLGARPT